MSKNLLTARSDLTSTVVVRENPTCRRKGLDSHSFRAVLLVEYRDEVFARLASDLAAMGVWVERASNAAEASQRFAHCPPDLMIVNADMPDESGWLLAGKLRLVRPTAHVWLYAPRSSGFDHGLAHFLGVAEVVHYDGDLFWLAEEIRSRVARLSIAARSVSCPQEMGMPAMRGVA